jgi:hypothetical protein
VVHKILFVLSEGAPTRRSVDQQTNRGARADPSATLNRSRLNAGKGETPFLKVTMLATLTLHLFRSRSLLA